MLLESFRQSGLAYELVNLPTQQGTHGGRFKQLLQFPVCLATYIRLAALTSGTVYLTIAQSRSGFLRDAFVILVGALFGHRVVCHLHGGNYGGFYESQTPMMRWFIRMTLRRTAAIIILSERLRPMFNFDPALSRRLYAIPNGLPLGLQGSAKTKTLPAGTDEPIQILYLSNLIESKGYFDVLRAVEILVNRFHLNVEAHFCGNFLDNSDRSDRGIQSQLERSFYDFVRTHNLESRVHYHGTVMDEAKVRFLSSAHVLVLPTNYPHEGQPISIIEAAAYSTVVVSTNYRAIPDLVVDEVTGRLVPFGDPQRLAEVLFEILSDPVRFAAMSCAGYLHYQRTYTADAHLRSLQTLVCNPESIKVQQPTDHAARTQDYFDQVASTWSERYSPGRSFAQRPSRFVSVIESKIARGSRVLDFGCGTGEVAYQLSQNGYAVWALDSSERMIDFCRRILADTNAHFLRPPINRYSKIEVPDGWFDAVVASSVLEYVDDIEQQLREMLRTLKSGGLLVCTIPNSHNLIRYIETTLAQTVRWRTLRIVSPFLSDRMMDYMRYLEFSINRWPQNKWEELFVRCGFYQIQVLSGLHDPLTQIVARRKSSATEVESNSLFAESVAVSCPATADGPTM
jgi:glycosyltransferase involved in cell wall biosynthesis/ubiquinone/menaquinone biosynthesis C-methylase UbiE